MKLRNKKTGEIGEMHEAGGYITVWLLEKAHGCTCENKNYGTLAELNEDWEDYEEPKEHWCITMYGGITSIKEPIDDLIEIGNYFNSKEAAYDALEKLKAGKRLKDKGFRFVGWDKALRRQEPCKSVVFCDFDDLIESEKDLDLLFSGEDD